MGRRMRRGRNRGGGEEGERGQEEGEEEEGGKELCLACTRPEVPFPAT